MKIEIMSRETLEQITAGPDFQKTAVISIIDSDAIPVHLRFAPDFLLPLCFDDMNPESDLMDELFKEFPEARNSASIITDRQAKKSPISC